MVSSKTKFQVGEKSSQNSMTSFTVSLATKESCRLVHEVNLSLLHRNFKLLIHVQPTNNQVVQSIARISEAIPQETKSVPLLLAMVMVLMH